METIVYANKASLNLPIIITLSLETQIKSKRLKIEVFLSACSHPLMKVDLFHFRLFIAVLISSFSRRSMVLSVLTYGLETIRLTCKAVNKLQVTQRAMERGMLGIRLQNKVPTEEIRRITQLTDVSERVAQLK